MPIGRSTSATGVPVSACFSAKAICSSVNLLFFTALLLPSGAHETGKLALTPDQGDGGMSVEVVGRDWKGVTAVRGAPEAARLAGLEPVLPHQPGHAPPA